MEQTFVMIKPDGVRKRIFKEVLDRFLKNGLSISNVDILFLDKNIINDHYNHLLDRGFYPKLLEYMLSGPVIVMTVSGYNAIMKVRDLIGSTNPQNAKEGTIRADYGDKLDMTYNVIHASDSLENAHIEVERFHNYQKKFIKD